VILRRAGGWLAAGLLALAAAGCGDKPSLAGAESPGARKSASLRQQLEEVQGVAGAPEVGVLKLEPGPISEELSITGELVPTNSAIVKPLMEGRITFVRPIKVGDIVKKGDVIAKIDDRDIEDDIDWQQKQLALSTEKQKIDEQALEQNKKDLEFDRQLVKEGFLNQHEFEKTELTLKQAVIALSQSRIALEQDRNKLNKANRLREKVPIVAPIGGMVVLASHLTSEEQTFSLLNEEILSLEGTLVGTTTPIFGIVSQDGYLAQCQANSRDKAKLQSGQAARVTVITHKPFTVTGRVTKVSLLQDAKTHAYKVWLALDEVDKTFTSGLFVRANILLSRREGALAIKKEYLKERNNRSFVQVVQGGTIKDRWVSTGIAQEDKIELESGVKAGEMLVASKEVFAAEQAVKPVSVEPEEEGEEQPDLKVLPAEKDALPLTFSSRDQNIKMVTLALDATTSLSRATLRVRVAGDTTQLKLGVRLNLSDHLGEPDKILHEGDDQIVVLSVPLKFLHKRRNECWMGFNGNYYSLPGELKVKSVELWLDKP